MSDPAPPNPSLSPDTISITEEYRDRIESRGADVLLKVSRSGVARRHAGALEAARLCVERAGIPPGSIVTRYVRRESAAWIPPLAAALLAVIAAVALHSFFVPAGLFAVVLVLTLAGGFRWLATTTFGLGVECPDAASVGRVLDATAAKGGLEVESISWRYELEGSTKDAMVERCIERANTRAAKVAHALGVRILGVHAYTEQYDTPGAAREDSIGVDLVTRRTRLGQRSLAPAHGPLSNTEPATVVVTVQYRVGEYQEGVALVRGRVPAPA